MTLEPLSGIQVVDLFAGSGAMGIEALSRGAIHADFVESDAAARAVLNRNLEALDLVSRARVWALQLPSAVSRLRPALQKADLVLADPPYGGELARDTLLELGTPGLLKRECRVVLEHHAKDEIPERCGDLLRARSRQYGETVVTTYRVAEEPSRRPTEAEATR